MAFSAVGIESAHLIFEDDNGQVVGGSPTLANDGYSVAHNMIGIQDFSFTVPEPNQVQVNGDNGSLFVFTFPPADVPTGSMTYTISDPVKAMEMQGSVSLKMSASTANADAAYFVNGDAFRQRVAWIVTHQPAQNASLTSFGNSGYAVSFYRVKLFYTGQQGMSFQGETTYNYTITGVLGAKTFWGSTIATVTNNQVVLAGGHADHFSTYPVVPVIYRGDTTPVTASTLPTGLSIVDVAEPIIAYRNGVQLTLASDAVSVDAGEWFYNTSTNAITYDTAGVGANDYVVLLVKVNNLRTGALA